MSESIENLLDIDHKIFRFNLNMDSNCVNKERILDFRDSDYY